MPTDLHMLSTVKARLLDALEGATSQQPVDTIRLYALGERTQIEAALRELYQARQVGCCKIINGGKERVVWWPVGGLCRLPRYGTGVPGFPRRDGRMAE